MAEVNYRNMAEVNKCGQLVIFLGNTGMVNNLKIVYFLICRIVNLLLKGGISHFAKWHKRHCNYKVIIFCICVTMVCIGLLSHNSSPTIPKSRAT